MLSSPTISPGSLGTGYRYQLSLSADGTFRADIDRLKEIAKKQENEKHQQQQEQKEKTNGFISESSGDNSDGNDSVQNNKNENQSDVNHQPPLSQQSGAMNTQEQDEFEDNQGPSRLSKVIQQIEQREASLKRTVLETNCLGGEYSDADGTGTGEDYYSDNSIVDDSEYHFLEEEKSSAENTGYYVARADKELPKDAIHSSENLSEDESPSNSLPVSSSVLPNTKNLPEDVQQSIARLKHKFEELVKKADGKEIRTLPKELDGALLDVAMVQDRHYPRGISTQVTEAISPIVGFQSSTLKSKMNLLKKVEKVRELQSQIESIEQQLKPIIEKEFRRYDQKIKQQEKQEQQEQEKQEKQPSLSSASSLSSSPPSSSSSSSTTTSTTAAVTFNLSQHNSPTQQNQQHQHQISPQEKDGEGFSESGSSHTKKKQRKSFKLSSKGDELFFELCEKKREWIEKYNDLHHKTKKDEVVSPRESLDEFFRNTIAPMYPSSRRNITNLKKKYARQIYSKNEEKPDGKKLSAKDLEQISDHLGVPIGPPAKKKSKRAREEAGLNNNNDNTPNKKQRKGNDGSSISITTGSGSISNSNSSPVSDLNTPSK